MSTVVPDPGRRRQRRELGAALGGAVVAGALALSSGGQTWVRLSTVRQPPLPPVTDQLSGGQIAPLVTATGLLLLAAAVALVATRGAGRIAVGLLMALAGGVLGWSGVRTLAGGATVDRSLSSVGASPGSRLHAEVSAAWPALALVAGLLAVLAGLLVVLRGRGWPGMGRRYERPGPAGTPARPAGAGSAEDRATAAWRALDRGDDPTADDPTADDPTADAGDPTDPAGPADPAGARPAGR